MSSILNLIKTRRTVYQFKKQSVENDLINTCLEAAIWAPNHKMMQPWQFYVVGSQTQVLLADIYARLRASKKFEEGSIDYESAYLKAKTKFLKIPKIVFVGQKLMEGESSIETQENYAACACAIQNFQLMAHQLTLGVQWSTGPIISDVRTFELFKINAQQIRLIGALYMGYYEGQIQSTRKPIEAVTTYLD